MPKFADYIEALAHLQAVELAEFRDNTASRMVMAKCQEFEAMFAHGEVVPKGVADAMRKWADAYGNPNMKGSDRDIVFAEVAKVVEGWVKND